MVMTLSCTPAPASGRPALGGLAPGAAGVVVGDVATAAETRELAGQVNEIGRMDAVIHDPASSLSHPVPRQPKGTRRPSRSMPSPPTCSQR